jgi:hypothetical protein
VNHQDIAKDLALAAPPIGVVATGIVGFPWSQISYMLAAVYTFGLIVKMAWSGWKAFQAWRFKRAMLAPVSHDAKPSA